MVSPFNISCGSFIRKVFATRHRVATRCAIEAIDLAGVQEEPDPRSSPRTIEDEGPPYDSQDNPGNLLVVLENRSDGQSDGLAHHYVVFSAVLLECGQALTHMVDGEDSRRLRRQDDSE